MRRQFVIALALLVALFRSTSALAGAITLAWDANPEADIAGYRIAYGTTSGSHPTVVDVGNRVTYQLRGLTEGQRYYFVVMAYNLGGVLGDPSVEITGNVLGLTAIQSDNSSPAPTGKSITWTALATQGLPLEYKFWRFSQTTGTWTMVRDYAASNTFSWTPGSGEEGTYSVQAWARVQGSPENYEAWRSTGFFSVANGPIKVGALDANVHLPAGQGTAITWTARAIGGPTPLQYKFWKFSEVSGTWSMLQDYGTSNTVTWTPSAGDLGRHALQVWVRAPGSTAMYDAYRSSGTFEVRNSPVGIGALNANVKLPAGTGENITWTAVAAGQGPLEYSFYRFSQATGGWVLAQNWSSSSVHTWTPTSTGTYAIQVWARRQGSTATFEAYRTSSLFQIANNTPTVRNIDSSVGAPYGTEAPVTFSVDAVGGPGPLQYAFWLYNQARDTWSQLRSYSTASTLTWTPNQGDAGSYALQAWVRRPASTATYDAYGSTSLFTVGNVAASVQSITPTATAVPVGTPVSVTAKGSGGPGLLEYKFFRYNTTTGQWVVAQEFGWNNTVNWVPGATDVGANTFQVWIRRVGTVNAYEGFLNAAPIQVN